MSWLDFVKLVTLTFVLFATQCLLQLAWFLALRMQCNVCNARSSHTAQATRFTQGMQHTQEVTNDMAGIYYMIWLA